MVSIISVFDFSAWSGRQAGRAQSLLQCLGVQPGGAASPLPLPLAPCLCLAPASASPLPHCLALTCSLRGVQAWALESLSGPREGHTRVPPSTTGRACSETQAIAPAPAGTCNPEALQAPHAASLFVIPQPGPQLTESLPGKRAATRPQQARPSPGASPGSGAQAVSFTYVSPDFLICRVGRTTPSAQRDIRRAQDSGGLSTEDPSIRRIAPRAAPSREPGTPREATLSDRPQPRAERARGSAGGTPGLNGPGARPGESRGRTGRGLGRGNPRAERARLD